MTPAKMIKFEKLTPVSWGYLEIRGDHEICPCVLGVGEQVATAATLIGEHMTLSLVNYGVEWRLWNIMPSSWECDACRWEDGQQVQFG